MELEPGTWGSWRVHPAPVGPELLGPWRRQLYLSYNKASDGGEQRAHYAEFQAWLVKKYAQYGKTETYFA